MSHLLLLLARRPAPSCMRVTGFLAIALATTLIPLGTLLLVVPRRPDPPTPHVRVSLMASFAKCRARGIGGLLAVKSVQLFVFGTLSLTCAQTYEENSPQRGDSRDMQQCHLGFGRGPLCHRRCNTVENTKP